MLDFAQYLITSADLSAFHVSMVTLASNFHINIADIHSFINIDLLAQQTPPQYDVLGDFGKGWNDFVKTGRIWALMIGVVVGYLFRSVTNA